MCAKKKEKSFCAVQFSFQWMPFTADGDVLRKNEKNAKLNSMCSHPSWGLGQREVRGNFILLKLFSKILFSYMVSNETSLRMTLAA